MLRLAFVVYASLLALVISRHEPWADEAQAWLMARDLGPFDLFVRFLRYEGTPGLWHLILMGPAQAGLPYCSMSIISGVIAACGVFVLLRYSRIPLPARLLLPFSFVLVYQYAVVARSYVLLPVLLFGIAALYRDRVKKIYLFTLLLCLLANTNIHGMLIALSLALIYAVGMPREWPSMTVVLRRKHLIASGLFAVVMALTVLQLLPPADIVSMDAPYMDYVPRLAVAGTEFLADSISLPQMPWLSIPIFAISLAWFWRHGALWEYLLPMLGLLLLFGLKHAAAWHEGVLFLVWLFAAWLGCERHSLGACRGGSRLRILDEFFPAVVVLVAITQVMWSVPTIRCDLTRSYSGSREAADYIKANHLQNRTICLTGYHSVAILPYFQDNLFANLNGGRKPACWQWSTKNPLIQDKWWAMGNLPKIIKEIRRTKPDIVVLSVSTSFERGALPLAGYVVAADCKGVMFWKGIPYENTSFVILRRENAEPPTVSASSP